MILETFEQGSAAWHRARLGIPTASHFDEILTPATLKPSSSAKGYMRKLLAEWVIGVPSDADSSGFMDRGTKLEPHARRWYEYECGESVRQVGIVLRDDRMVGASPDGLVGEDGILEIKCPAAATHVRNMLDGMSGYTGQIQGALWLTGRKWADLLSYNPELPPSVVRIDRNETYIEALEEAMEGFLGVLLSERARLLKMGCTPASRLMLPANMATEDPF